MTAKEVILSLVRGEEMNKKAILEMLVNGYTQKGNQRRLEKEEKERNQQKRWRRMQRQLKGWIKE